MYLPTYTTNIYMRIYIIIGFNDSLSNADIIATYY